MKVSVKKLPKSEVEIEGELDAETLESYFGKALKRLGDSLDLDGFRKGKIPENVLISKIPEIRILEEMAELALAEHYPKIVESEKLDAISRPEVSVTKLARKNPLGFKIKTAILPEIKLPKYKDIAKGILRSELGNLKRSDLEVSDEDVENTIMDIRKSRAPNVHMTEGASVDEKEKSIEPELPPFNDEFVQALGQFKNVEDFKIKLKENIKLEKENQQKEKTRLKIIEKIIEESALDVPEILIEVELEIG